ncbi:MAG: DUF3089 domain-containing protein [Caulobacteraceae bacterium]|nr:DUF3089 domain-containing protein [Caulobacteraceae bacterium]
MARWRPGLKDWWWISGLVLLALLLAAAIIWRGDILRSFLDPKTPFQTYRPPKAPDYSQRAAWALMPAAPGRWTSADPPADVFFVHPTTFDGGRDWNDGTHDQRSNRFLDHTILPNYAGPFVRVGRLFAPHYRQASVFSQLNMRDDSREAREFAYGDVRRAFDYYLDHDNGGRPLVLAGVEQGATLVDRLAREEIAARPGLIRQIAAVYLIDTVALADDFGPSSPLPACERRGEPRCVVGWTQSWAWDEADVRRTFNRSLVWDAEGHLQDVNGRAILCVNPMYGYATEAAAPARLNLGAANASDVDWGTRPAFLTRQVWARCKQGILRVSRPPSPSLKDTGGFTERLKEPGYNLFYADTEADALGRLAALMALPDAPRPAATP